MFYSFSLSSFPSRISHMPIWHSSSHLKYLLYAVIVRTIMYYFLIKIFETTSTTTRSLGLRNWGYLIATRYISRIFPLPTTRYCDLLRSGRISVLSRNYFLFTLIYIWILFILYQKFPFWYKIKSTSLLMTPGAQSYLRDQKWYRCFVLLFLSPQELPETHKLYEMW